MHYRGEVLLSFNRAEVHQISNYFMAVTCESWEACAPRIKKSKTAKLFSVTIDHVHGYIIISDSAERVVSFWEIRLVVVVRFLATYSSNL